MLIRLQKYEKEYCAANFLAFNYLQNFKMMSYTKSMKEKADMIIQYIKGSSLLTNAPVIMTITKILTAG